MTWSKESIGNSAAAETTPNGSRKVPGTICRRRSSTGRTVARARSFQSTGRKHYSPRRQLTLRLHSNQYDVSSPPPEVPPSQSLPTTDDSPRRCTANARRTQTFQRFSRHRTAFKTRGPRVVPDTQRTPPPHDDGAAVHRTLGSENDESYFVVKECINRPVDPTQTDDGDEVYAVESVQITFEDNLSDSETVPEPALLHAQETADNKEDCSDIGPEPMIMKVALDDGEGDHADVGPNPVALVDVDVVVDTTGDTKSDSVGKRPSMIKRMLQKSTTLAKKTTRGHRHQLSPRQQRRQRVPMKRMVRRPRKVVVMGDMFSGKSNLISAYCRDKFSTNYTPTLLNTCLTDAKVFGENIELVIVEVVGRDDYARLRKCAYHKMDAIILCYSADNPEGLQRVVDYWVPELKCHAPKVPFILVATKKDIRDELLYEQSGSTLEREGVVPTTRGQRVAKSIGAHTFLECSALYRDNTRNVFETAAKVALQKSRRKRK